MPGARVVRMLVTRAPAEATRPIAISACEAM